MPGDQQPYGDARAIKLEDANFASGSLRVTSYARPAKLFTANRDLIVAQVATLNQESFTQIIDTVVKLFRGGS